MKAMLEENLPPNAGAELLGDWIIEGGDDAGRDLRAREKRDRRARSGQETNLNAPLAALPRALYGAPCSESACPAYFGFCPP